MEESKQPATKPHLVEDRPCPISGSCLYQLEGYATDFLYSHRSFPLLRNISSGLLITGDAPPEEELGNFYKSDQYISHTDSHKGLTNRLFQVARGFTLPAKYRSIASYLCQRGGKGILVDVGCGTGQFASLVQSKGHQVYCVEQSSEARQYAYKHFGLECFPTLPEVQLTLSADVITLWHVLEHIDSLDQHFALFRQILNPQGTLIIALPNHTSYDARHYRHEWAAYDVPRHLWHFSPSTIKLLAEKEGFRCIRTKRMPLDAFYIALLSEKNQGTRLAKALIKAFGIGMMGLFRSLFKKSESSSLIYYFQKKEDCIVP